MSITGELSLSAPRKRRQRAKRIVALFAFGAVLCGASLSVTWARRKDRMQNQIKPPEAFISPKMDFTKIQTLAIFPLFPGSGSLDDAQFAEALVNALTSEVQARQSQWKIVPYRDVLTLINTKNLGTGYKNLQADFNTYAGASGMLVITPATKEFLNQMRETSGVDAFLLGSYKLSNVPVTSQTFLGSVTREQPSCSLNLSLWYAKDGETWWTAGAGRYGPHDAVIKELSESLGSYLGKGTLRQL